MNIDLKDNIANILTIARMIMLPVMVALFYLEKTYLGTAVASVAVWLCFSIYIIAAITDYLDGYIARKFNQISEFGTFLDPISDKIMVACVLIMLIVTDRVDAFGVILILLIFTREFLISGLREYMGPKNIKVPVMQLAKWKTAVQMIACGILILSGVVDSAHLYGMAALFIATVLTLWTGYAYLKVGFSNMRENP